MNLVEYIKMQLALVDSDQTQTQERLASELRSLAEHAATAERANSVIPELSWIECNMSKLRELREAYREAELARELLNRLLKVAHHEM